MSDEQVLEPLKVTVGYSRKITPKQYENAEASVFFQVPVDLGDDAEAIQAKVIETFSAAKSSVFTQLGLDFNVDPLTNVVEETLSRVLGASPVAAPTAAPTEAFQPNTAYESMSKADQKAARAADVASNPNGWFDNTQDKRNPKAPDYKSKRTNAAFPDGTGHWRD